MRRIMTATAAVALLAGAAQAQGSGKGHEAGGHGGSHGAGAAAQGGGGDGKARGNGHRGGGEAVGSRQGGGSKARGEAQAARSNADDRGHARSPSDARAKARAGPERGNDGRLVTTDGRARGGNDARHGARGRDFAAIPVHGLVAGCPPGLAKKNPRCVPPGHVRSPFRAFDRPDFWGLRLTDGRYRYSDGYLVRLAPDGRIGGYIPLLGGALAIGNPWPAVYETVALPAYYENYYRLGATDSYRYADNVIYQVDPETAAITSIAALLTGDRFVVGEAMPAGYDVYNVPYPYRAQYHDTPDAAYRYSDGYLYQVDPTTQLVAAAIELLAA
jgi:hypothetical protein